MANLPFVHRRDKHRRKHRADDRIAQLVQDYEKKLADLREENVLVHNRLASADDYFMQLDHTMKQLEAENERLAAQVADERTTRIGIEKDRDALERYLRDLEGQLADAERRLDVRAWAEAAATATQEMPTIRVMPLTQAPFAATVPARLPSWAERD